MLRRIIARLLGRGAPTDEEIARELQDHLDLEALASAECGVRSAEQRPTASHEDKEAHALRTPPALRTREDIRAVWRWAWLEQLEQDVRLGLRAIAHSPLYAAAVVITLAMGIGAATTVYSFSKAIHDPFPILPSDRLLWITQTNPTCGVDCTQASPAAVAALQSRAQSIIAIGAIRSSSPLRTANGSEALNGFQVSPNTFETIEAPFAAGHGFPKGADELNAPHYVVLSYDLWQRRFVGSRGLIDSTITLGEQPFTVVGVLAKDVVFPTAADVYTPSIRRAEDATSYGSRLYDVFARIAPGASVAQAAAEVSTIGRQLSLESPRTDSGCVLRARPIAAYHTDDVAVLVQISAIAALLVFLAGCMSAANLVLSRLAARRHELALRAALGVRRWRLARPLLTESLLLSLVAGDR